ncbi:MAG: hypothetical protein MUF40_03905 [Gemmatimonadaceae bacterium]|nr:hypothetical protein [Gemmatimonadaceae bacterium]
MSAAQPATHRVAALAARAAALGEARAAVVSVARAEAATLGAAAAAFFEQLPLRDFPGTLLPRGAQAERRVRHKVLRESRRQDERGTTVALLLLGRDARLRTFMARSTSARDLDDTFATGRPTGEVRRELVDWNPDGRGVAFATTEVLGGLSSLLDDVERRLVAAESRLAVQARAFASGDTARIAAALAPPDARRPAVAPAEPSVPVEAIVPSDATPAASARPASGADASEAPRESAGSEPPAPTPPPVEPSWITRAVRAGARTPTAITGTTPAPGAQEA